MASDPDEEYADTDDLLYMARIGEVEELKSALEALAQRQGGTPAEVLVAAKSEEQKTPLHMAAGNGHLSKTFPIHMTSRHLLECCIMFVLCLWRLLIPISP